MKRKIRVGIVGGAGYTGGETLRLLLNHPAVDIAFVHSRSNDGMPAYKVHTDLLGDTELRFVSEIDTTAEVIFLCLGHGEAKEWVAGNTGSYKAKLIDLSQDFRLSAGAVFGNRHFVYGLPEVNREQIRTAESVANPGCFATAIQLALLPLAQGGLLKDVHVTGITGSTGAGQKLQHSSHFTWRANNIEAYKSLAHQHMYEIMETLIAQQVDVPSVNFIPWRGNFTRGIYLTAYTGCDKPVEDITQLYKAFYDTHPFTHVANSMINLKQVVNTNKCLLYVEKSGDKIIVHAAIDNLLKGASGQAVQNMNLMFGLDETAGLKLKATSF